MDKNKKYSDFTKAVHAGVEDNEHLAVVPPIYQTSTFKFRDADHGASLFSGSGKGYIYTRMGNPTIKALENQIQASDAMIDLARKKGLPRLPVRERSTNSNLPSKVRV